MKSWKLTSAIALIAIATAAIAFLYGKDEAKEKETTTQVTQKEENLDFIPEVVATYGDKKITREELISLIKEISKSFPGAANKNLDPEIIKVVAPNIVNGMIDKKILLDLAAADGIKPSKEIAVKLFEQSISKVPEKQMEEFKQKLAAEGKTIDTFKEELTQQPMMQEDSAIMMWREKNIDPKIKITEEDVEKFYNEHKDTFSTQETVNASHILVKSKSESEEDMENARKKCEEIKKEIDEGKITFEDAAEKYSDCPSGKEAKGNLGKFGKGSMIKEFEDTAFAMKLNEISDPVKTTYGYHLIKVLEHNNSVVTPLADVKTKISDYLKEEEARKEIQKILEEKRKELNVKVFLPEAQIPPIQIQQNNK
ncbi:MAG TPA: peptidylprolyl isomerase [Victivallales bacterium]|nr:peptidylprolyl isomerase [Victivallales bacterium]HPO91267.1 peptidylprolyl isomerase [Victivallales bacterium]HRU02049.1 peptidylprolyl isomerase [Victivallales bacterium]